MPAPHAMWLRQSLARMPPRSQKAGNEAALSVEGTSGLRCCSWPPAPPCPTSPHQRWAAHSPEKRQVWSSGGITDKQHEAEAWLQSMGQTAGSSCELRWPFSPVLSTRVTASSRTCSGTQAPPASHLRPLLHHLPSFSTFPARRRSSGLPANSILCPALERGAGAPSAETWARTDDAKVRMTPKGLLALNAAPKSPHRAAVSLFVWKGLRALHGALRLLSPLLKFRVERINLHQRGQFLEDWKMWTSLGKAV